MAKQTLLKTWQVVGLLIACLIGGVGLLLASASIQPATASAPTDPASRSAMGMSSLLQLLGLIGLATSVVCAGVLGYRYYLSIPAWKRRHGPPKRR